MMQRFLLAIGVPILSMVVIAAYAGTVGVTFIRVHHAMHNPWGVVILGMLLVIGVPVVAFLAQNAVEKES